MQNQQVQFVERRSYRSETISSQSESQESVARESTSVCAPGRVFLVSEILKDLRGEKLQSQEEMAFACSDKKIRVSIASIKRAETGRPVIYRIARELARYFDVPVQKLIRSDGNGKGGD